MLGTHRSLLRTLALAGLLVPRVGLAASEAEPGNAKTFVFECPDGSSRVVQATEGDAWLFRAVGSVRLVRVEASAPARYAGDGLQLVIDGDQGIFSADGAGATTCRNDRGRAVWEHAKLSGVDFRAVGNEPPWVVEMRELSRVVLITEYGAKRVERTLPPPVRDADGRTTRWDAGDLKIAITAQRCHDSMSGESFESTVVVQWQDRPLRGCGRPLH